MGSRAPPPPPPPADIVRLLTILADSEERLSRSANQRMLVEVLLLRWAMLDRTVELSEVIDALKGVGPSDSRTVGRSQTQAPASAEPSTQVSPAVKQSDRPTGQKLEPTLENVRSIWAHVVSDARAKAPLLGSLLAEAEPIAVDGRVVTLRPDNEGHAEGLERQRDVIAQAIGRFISEAPLVKIVAGQGREEPGAGPGRGARGPERMTEERATAERLKSLRAKDPTLSAAVDALDLELLE